MLPVSHFKSKEPCSAWDRTAHIHHRTMTAITANFTFNFKIFLFFFLIELPAKLFGEPQNCRVGTFRLQQGVFVVAAGPIHHFQHAGKSPLRFVPRSQALPATTHRLGRMQAQEDKKKADKSVTSYRWVPVLFFPATGELSACWLIPLICLLCLPSLRGNKKSSTRGIFIPRSPKVFPKHNVPVYKLFTLYFIQH